VIRPFDVLRVNYRMINAEGELVAEVAGEWTVWAHVKDQEELRYLAGLSAQSSEPVVVEVGRATDAVPRIRGRAWIHMGGEALPTEAPAVVRFVGAGPFDVPDDA
jgi:hypothetical protein